MSIDRDWLATRLLRVPSPVSDSAAASELRAFLEGGARTFAHAFPAA